MEQDANDLIIPFSSVLADRYTNNNKPYSLSNIYTQGSAMGWGFVALGFGLSFGVSIMMLGYISAHLNPATCLALWILGRMDIVEFIAAVSGEFLGAFIGAFLVWLHYLPHFKTVPEPAPRNEGEHLLRTRDALTPQALNIASYNTDPDMKNRRPDVGIDSKYPLAQAIRDFKYFASDSHYEPVHEELVGKALGRSEERRNNGHDLTRSNSYSNSDGESGREAVMNRLGRRTVQVCDVHRRLKDVDLEDFQRLAGVRPYGTGSGAPLVVEDVERMQPHVDHMSSKLDKMYECAVIADQNSKLSIFATRPAINTKLFNFITEFMSTTALVYGALMMYARRDLLRPEDIALFRSYEGMWIGFFVFVAILGLGGPTGIAANPARDFSPRLAHFLLPIPGKGTSEFGYAWIPFLAPLVGGCAAAGLYAATQLLNHSEHPK